MSTRIAHPDTDHRVDLAPTWHVWNFGGAPDYYVLSCTCGETFTARGDTPHAAGMHLANHVRVEVG